MEVPRELREAYLERRKQDLENCLVSLRKGQFHEIENLGHQLKGSGLTFGHPKISEMGQEIEIAAQAEDRYKIICLLDELSVWINQKH